MEYHSISIFVMNTLLYRSFASLDAEGPVVDIGIGTVIGSRSTMQRIFNLFMKFQKQTYANASSRSSISNSFYQ